jgi:hypothetical protein
MATQDSYLESSNLREDAMTTTTTALSHRDRAVLRAIAAGRGEISDLTAVSLVIDGMSCCDQLVGPRLAQAGLIAASGARPGPARLTPSGQALLQAA